MGKKPKIVIWDAHRGQHRVIKFHLRGVSNLAFSKELLVSAGLDTDRMIAVHNVSTGSLVGKAGRGIDVLTIVVSNDGRFVTGGKGHIVLGAAHCKRGGRGATYKGGIYNNKAIKCRTIVSSTFLGTDCITGMSDGSLVLEGPLGDQVHQGSPRALRRCASCPRRAASVAPTTQALASCPASRRPNPHLELQAGEDMDAGRGQPCNHPHL